MHIRIVIIALMGSIVMTPVLAATGPVSSDIPKPFGQPLFVSGQDGYHTYRIPALAVTHRGTVLAFCEGRKHGGSDSGDIDLLVKRSEDHGRRWSEQRVLWDHKDNTCGNPCAVVDRSTGTIWLLSTWNLGKDREGAIISQTSQDTRRVFVMASTDDGVTWSEPQEITTQAAVAVFPGSCDLAT